MNALILGDRCVRSTQVCWKLVTFQISVTRDSTSGFACQVQSAYTSLKPEVLFSRSPQAEDHVCSEDHSV